MEDLDRSTKEYQNVYKKPNDVLICGKSYGTRDMFPNTALNNQFTSTLFRPRPEIAPLNYWGRKQIRPEGPDDNMYKFSRGPQVEFKPLKVPKVEKFYNTACL